jgi:hypothetical protein
MKKVPIHNLFDVANQVSVLLDNNICVWLSQPNRARNLTASPSTKRNYQKLMSESYDAMSILRQKHENTIKDDWIKPFRLVVFTKSITIIVLMRQDYV